jgi:undecaprenyl pyrophosphate synthase
MSEFYTVNDSDEFITATSIEEAIQDWYDDLTSVDDFTEEVTVYKYETDKISNKILEWALEALIENLDENYGCEETWGDYELSDEAKTLWEAFTDKVREEYKVSTLRQVNKITVRVRDYVEVDLEGDFKV